MELQKGTVKCYQERLHEWTPWPLDRGSQQQFTNQNTRWQLLGEQELGSPIFPQALSIWCHQEGAARVDTMAFGWRKPAAAYKPKGMRAGAQREGTRITHFFPGSLYQKLQTEKLTVIRNFPYCCQHWRPRGQVNPGQCVLPGTLDFV